jgi:hypothetical protein
MINLGQTKLKYEGLRLKYRQEASADRSDMNRMRAELLEICDPIFCPEPGDLNTARLAEIIPELLRKQGQYKEKLARIADIDGLIGG